MSFCLCHGIGNYASFPRALKGEQGAVHYFDPKEKDEAGKEKAALSLQ